MKHSIFNNWKHSAFLLFLFVLTACQQSGKIELEADREIYVPRYTKSFNIYSNTDSTLSIITIQNPWQGAENVSYPFILTKGNEIEDNYKGKIIPSNPKRIVCMSSTHIAMLDALGASDLIVGVSGKEYISNPKINSSSRFIPDIGYEGNIDYEALVTAKPDLVLLFAINGKSSMQPRLEELGIPYIYIGDYLEEDPLGKAEWLTVIGELIGKRDESIKLFKNIEERYINLKLKVEDADLAKPTVMVNAPFLDSWFMPSTKSYVARMIEDAGGDYIYKKDTGTTSLPIDEEEALQLLSLSDFWINIGSLKSKEELIENYPKFAAVDCVIKGNIFNNNLRSTPGRGNDCYESGVVNPDLILKDMIKIFHPELISDEFTYYHQLR